MNKKTLFSLVGAASIAVSLSATAPVLAAETTNPNTTSTTTNNTDQKDTTTTTPSAGQTGTTDTSKTSTTGQTGTTDTSKTPATGTTDTTKPTTSKPINTADLNKALSLSGKGKYAKLTRNSYVYDAKGKRIKNAKLKKGTIIAVNGVITPDNQVLIGYNNEKGKYIKVNNVELFKAVQYKVKKNAYVYDSKGKQNMRVYLPKGKKVTVFKTKKIKGVKYVAVSDSLYIKWSVLDHKSGKVVSG
ncbi:SLAP domain-containing protein [Lactobacillus apis]|uniref:SLAP domain-containing protein n=1 Tax=Lactobacillus apis TaxID=303541 RepID=UPI00242A601A|nr:SLAP domain-containing protein [Lactobacillus apis]